jgi:ABC-type Zn uptake system ZnuABC Zn-binding protein ZnuA
VVNVRPIIKPGIDPHEFQPSPLDVRQIESADLVLITDKGIEGYLTKLEEGEAGSVHVAAGEAQITAFRCRRESLK